MMSDDLPAEKLEAAAGATEPHPALPLVRPFIAALQRSNRALRRLSANTHRLQGALEGRFDRRRMWFDHYVDLNYKWPAQGDAAFLERGLFSRLCLTPGADVLEIACGDGFYSRHFYGPAARSVLATDIDPAAVEFARRVNARENVRFEVHDIRLGLPGGSVSHVIWDSALLFLTEAQLAVVVAQIHARVGGGKFTGHVAYEPHLDQPFVRHWFRDGEDLAAFLKRTFEYALVFTTESPGRVNYYFLASDTAPEVSVLQLRTPSTGQTPATYTNA
jgi:SAM-dependent methyltransferase